MLAYDVHGACLRPFFAGFLGETQLGADLQIIEVGTNETVAVKIDVSPVERLKSAVILLGCQNGDAPVGGRLVHFHLAPSDPHVVL